MVWIGDALPVGVELGPAGHAVDVGVDGLAGQRLELLPGQGERRVDLAPDLEVPRREVRVRARSRSGGPGTCRSCTGRAGSARRSRDPASWLPKSRSNMRLVLESGWVRRRWSHTADDGPVTRAAWRARPLRYPSPVRSPDDPAAATRRQPRPRVVIVMPAYNAARTLERTYADIPHDLVDRIILVDDVSRDETVEIARQLGLDVIIHARTGLRRQPEDVLRRGARGRRRHRRHAPSRLPVRRDADPGARSRRSPRASAT